MDIGISKDGLEGAGIATLISRIFIAFALLWVVFKNERFKEYIDLRKEAWKINLHSFTQILKLGIPSGLQFGLEVGAFSVSGIIIGWFGATQQAAHQIALNIASFTFMIIMGLATAGSIRISNALGRNNILQMRNIGLRELAIGIGYGVFSGLLFIIFHNQLPQIFNQDIKSSQFSGSFTTFCSSISNIRFYSSNRYRIITRNERRENPYLISNHCILDNRFAIGILFRSKV